MKNWFSKNLGDAMLASDAIESIKESFLQSYTNSGSPNDMAVFIHHESEGRLHCEVNLYFSPATANIAQKLNAVPCQKPYPNGLGLLAGTNDAWPLLFSDHPR